MFVDDAARVLGRFRQSFQDAIAFTLDYTDWLSTGDTVFSATYTVTPATTEPLGVTSSVPSGSTLSFVLSGGVPETTYKLQVTVTTSNNQTKTSTIVVDIDTFVEGATASGINPTDSSVLAQLLAAATSAGNSATTAKLFADDIAQILIIVQQAETDSAQALTQAAAAVLVANQAKTTANATEANLTAFEAQDAIDDQNLITTIINDLQTLVLPGSGLIASVDATSKAVTLALGLSNGSLSSATAVDAANDKIEIYSAADNKIEKTTPTALVSSVLTALGISGAVIYTAGTGIAISSSNVISLDSTYANANYGDGNLIVGDSAGAAPAATIGRNGDYFEDTTNGYQYGPKASGAWPATPVYKPTATGSFIPKAWGVVGSDGTLVASSGVTSVSLSGDAYTVTLASAMGSANYAVLTTIIEGAYVSNGFMSSGGAGAYASIKAGQTTTQFVVETWSLSLGNPAQTNANFSFAVFGN
ncbi:hypothetical protein H2LOC_010690 [Methylocystis heyeri]|uniref:Uncharacterized protein n=2 Tax=Methylocystis heyeri TaxID=391905 RepID=A0A6B8KHY6_9HYPH|nr:hypothetical protein H2LOC_010690 [Methylocystis heyeri]